MDWPRLSNVGQTYGGVSALLTALALIGVVISILYQVHGVNIAREQARRTFHNELLRMELDNPVYMEALGAPWGMQIAADYDSLRKFNFIHMWVSFWQSRYVLNEMPEAELRAEAASGLFRGTAGRSYWAATRAIRMEIATGRALQFSRILEEEYDKAVAKGPPKDILLSPKTERATGRSLQERALTEGGTILCIAVGIVMGRLMSRRRPGS
jgi:hypothetical protein